MGNGNKVEKFEDLDVWKRSQDLAVELYKLSAAFPKSEQFGLTNQLRRASYSVSANIAEGFGRRNPAEKAQFYKIAYGSLLETKSFMYLSQKLGFIDDGQISELIETITVLQKQINALIGSMS